MSLTLMLFKCQLYRELKTISKWKVVGVDLSLLELRSTKEAGQNDTLGNGSELDT